MDAEHVAGLIKHAGQSHALRGSRQSRTNPSLKVIMSTSQVEWTIEGLRQGDVEPIDPNDIDRLDFYFLLDLFRTQRVTLPVPTVAPGGGALRPKYSWGTQGPGKPPIQPGVPALRFPVLGAEMVFGQPHCFRAAANNEVILHLDLERLPYPHPTGGPLLQAHFGVQAMWVTKLDGRLKNSFARIWMDHQQYADIYDEIMRT
ncbi:MAG: hypothetical protein KF696_01245 [Planctomycetes bacterium]|nr:hypothetical protein [Planctomycetota bacterium]MCW8134435.1 hypothetical protein [Planctomycetota bacterium]